MRSPGVPAGKPLNSAVSIRIAFPVNYGPSLGSQRVIVMRKDDRGWIFRGLLKSQHEFSELMTLRKRPAFWATQGWIGLILLAICWPLNWTMPGMRTAYLFFPLWLGYILVVDALVVLRSGDSIWTRSRRDFVLLFVASSPVWWLFEMINHRTANWEYLGSNSLTPVEYYVLCTLSFSTVMPAVFETAELVRSFTWIQRLATGKSFQPGRELPYCLFLGGLALLGLTLAWPRHCYPFVWISIVLILEP